MSKTALLFLALTAPLAAPLAAQVAPPGLAADPSAPAPTERPLLADAEGNSLDPMMLQLRDGGILWGAIETHDPDGLTFQRLDNGGRLALPWGWLDPRQEQELRLRYGYVDLEVEEVQIKAHRIPLLDGTELIGLIVSHTPESLRVKTATSLVTIPTHRVAEPPTRTLVPALDIYTRDELYEQKLAEHPEIRVEDVSEHPELAATHLDIAAYCERILAFAQARKHYVLAEDANPAAITPELEQRAARAHQKAQVQEQVDYLGEAQLWRARKQFDRALAMLADFGTLYPDSPLQEDMLKEREKTLQAQERALREAVAKKWHFWTAKIAHEKGRDVSFQEAQAYADGAMSEDVAEAVRKDMENIDPTIDVDRVRRLWQERKGYKIQRASYGLATWLLGPEKARAELEKDVPKEEPKTDKDAERQKLENKIERYIKNQQRQQRSASTQGTDEDPEAYWATMSPSQKASWIKAYYVEFSGDMQLLRLSPLPCRTCGGTGAREVVATGSAGNRGTEQAGLNIVTCPTCHTVGVVRRVNYK